MTEPHELEDSERVSLCEALDRILNKGAVVVGEVTISVANIDLIYLALEVVLTSVSTKKAIERIMIEGVLADAGIANVGVRDGGSASERI